MLYHLILAITVTTLLAPFAAAQAQSGAIEPAPIATSSAVVPQARATSTLPRPTPAQAITPIATTSVMAPAATTTLSSSSEEGVTPNSGNATALIVIFATTSMAVGVFVALQTDEKKKDGKEESEDGRCFDVKKLMDEKLKDLTDLKGHVRSRAEEKARATVKGVATGTMAGTLLEQIEHAEKEYGRLKILYEQCMVEMEPGKRIVIVHGWDGYPEEGWFPWLKKSLEAKGHHVIVPHLPDAGHPNIESWVAKLAENVGTVDKNTYFVGHSLGCQTIARYLASLPNDVRVGGVVFVAGFFKHLTALDGPEEKDIATHWLGTPFDLEKVKVHLPHSVAIFSDNDPFVPLDNQDDFKTIFDSEVIIEHAKGHFSGPRDGIKELPIVLEKITELLT